MKYEKTKNSWRVYFSTAEYNQLLDAVPHRDARIAARLMAHSLRVGTVSDITLDQFRRRETSHGDIWTLRVEAKETSRDRDQSTRTREVWICEPLIEEIKVYAGVDEFTESKKLFPRKPRTIQYWIEKTRENAAKATGDRDFLKVSSHDFRRYFASHMLYRHGLDAEIVRQLGGWRSPQAMLEYLQVPDDILADELGSARILGAEADKRPAAEVPYRENHAIETLAHSIETAEGQEELRDLAERLATLFDDVDDVSLTADSAASPLTQTTDSLKDGVQTSFMQLEDLNKDESAGSTPGEMASTLPTFGLRVLPDRLHREKEAFFSHPDVVKPTGKRAVAGVFIYIAFVTLLGVQFALDGIVFDPTTGAWAGAPTETAGMLIGTTLGAGNVLRMIRRDFGL